LDFLFPGLRNKGKLIAGNAINKIAFYARCIRATGYFHPASWAIFRTWKRAYGSGTQGEAQTVGWVSRFFLGFRPF
jgi:hypothetical protein